MPSLRRPAVAAESVTPAPAPRCGGSPVTRRSEAGSAGLLALVLASALGAAGIFSLSPALAHAETIAGKEQLITGGQQLIVSPPASVQQARNILTANDPSLPLSSSAVASRSGLVGLAVSPNGWALAEVAGGHCVVVSGSASTGISESEMQISTGERCVA